MFYNFVKTLCIKKTFKLTTQNCCVSFCYKMPEEDLKQLTVTMAEVSPNIGGGGGVFFLTADWLLMKRRQNDASLAQMK